MSDRRIYAYQVARWLKDDTNEPYMKEFAKLLELEAEGEEIGFIIDCFECSINNVAIPAAEKRLDRMKRMQIN